MYARRIITQDVKKLEGELFTFIEALGLSELQDNGAKGTVSRLVQNWAKDCTPETDRTKALEDGLDMAWGLIANANEGNWDKATKEWRKAAEEWRDKNLPLTDSIPTD